METGHTRSRCRSHPLARAGLALSVLALGLLFTDARVARADGDLAPLSSVGVPKRTGGTIINNAAAIKLGKALFWDEQTGGASRTSTAPRPMHDRAANTSPNPLPPRPRCTVCSGRRPPAAAELLSANH